MIPNWSYMRDQFGIIQDLHLFPIPQTSFLAGTFFAVSYGKTALVCIESQERNYKTLGEAKSNLGLITQ